MPEEIERIDNTERRDRLELLKLQIAQEKSDEAAKAALAADTHKANALDQEIIRREQELAALQQVAPEDIKITVELPPKPTPEPTLEDTPPADEGDEDTPPADEASADQTTEPSPWGFSTQENN